MSAPDLATTVIFEDDPLPPLHAVRAQHVQLRTAVSAVRAAAALPPPVFTDSSLAGVGLVGYDRPPLQSLDWIWSTDVKALRGGVR